MYVAIIAVYEMRRNDLNHRQSKYITQVDVRRRDSPKRNGTRRLIQRGVLLTDGHICLRYVFMFLEHFNEFPL